MKLIESLTEKIKIIKDRHKIEINLSLVPRKFQDFKLLFSESHPFDPDVKIIWLKTPKTAGSAIQQCLENIGYLHMMQPEKRPITGVFSGQMDSFINTHSEFWASAHKFAIVRNPYDRFVSGWKYLRSTQDIDLVEVLQNLPNKEPRYGDYTHLTMTQTELLYLDGKLIPDKILRYENLSSDLNNVLLSFDLPPVVLPVVNKGRHRDQNFMKYFTADAHELFLENYGIDFDNFGYKKEF